MLACLSILSFICQKQRQRSRFVGADASLLLLKLLSPSELEAASKIKAGNKALSAELKWSNPVQALLYRYS